MCHNSWDLGTGAVTIFNINPSFLLSVLNVKCQKTVKHWLPKPKDVRVSLFKQHCAKLWGILDSYPLHKTIYSVPSSFCRTRSPGVDNMSRQHEVCQQVQEATEVTAEITTCFPKATCKSTGWCFKVKCRVKVKSTHWISNQMKKN